jgi:hypothetical protein
MSKWHILPGMGASSAMYNALRHKLDFKVNFINWPLYSGEKTYADVAGRVVRDNNIQNGDVVGGSSLGGMIALEIGKLIQPQALILIGSAVNTDEIQSLLAMLAPLAMITPISVVQLLAGKQKNLVSTMFADADSEFIRAMCAYLPRWPGYNGKTDIIRRLHGKLDHIIPCPAVGVTVVENAGHLVAMTHVNETAAFLAGIRSKMLPG